VRSWLSVCGLAGHGGNWARGETSSILEQAEAILKWAGGSLRNVARTWFWLSDIQGSYDPSNRALEALFKKRGLLGHPESPARRPATAFIGAHAAGSNTCSLDLFAVIGEEESIRFVDPEKDRDGSHVEGAPASSATVARMPSGSTVFVSGTAGNGHHGIPGPSDQVYDTITRVRSILGNLGCDDNDVLSASVYCATLEVEHEFREYWSDLPWPRVVIPARVSPPGVSFEIEVTASPGVANHRAGKMDGYPR
jgi:enamine deaminase RidA (YjgF/YER057c/UK114 family)